MGTMAVMAELHQMPDLKLNLKFEVEVLCNTLSLDLKVNKTNNYTCLRNAADVIITLEYDCFLYDYAY